MTDDYKPDTLGVRAGGLRSDFREHSEALVLTTSFVFTSAAEAARRFANEEPGNIYSRFTNPTVAMFQSRLAALEGAEACVATSTGMAAVATMAMGLLSAGDHLVAARGVFGTVVPLFNQILGRFGIETTWVELDGPRRVAGRDAAAHEAPVRRDAVEPGLRDRRHRGPRGDRAGGGRRPRHRQLRVQSRRCSARSTSARTSWSIPPPSTSTARAACSAAPSPGAATWSRGRSSISCAPPDPRSRPSTRGCA